MPARGQTLQHDVDTLAFLERAQRGLAEPAQPVRFSNGTGYDAVIDQGRRKRPSGINRSEDQELTPFDRWRLYTAGRDITRNSPAVAFAVRKHLDYVSKFSWRNKTRDPRKKAALAEKLREWSRPENCDVAGRHSLMRLVRLAERARTVDGKWSSLPSRSPRRKSAFRLALLRRPTSRHDAAAAVPGNTNPPATPPDAAFEKLDRQLESLGSQLGELRKVMQDLQQTMKAEKGKPSGGEKK
jgi:hypothetical protein